MSAGLCTLSLVYRRGIVQLGILETGPGEVTKTLQLSVLSRAETRRWTRRNISVIPSASLTHIQHYTER